MFVNNLSIVLRISTCLQEDLLYSNNIQLIGKKFNGFLIYNRFLQILYVLECLHA